MLNLLAPLVLALVSSLAYLAVKHPAIYEKLFNKLYLLLCVIFLAMVVWSSAVSMAFTAVLPFIKPDNLDAAKLAADNIAIPFSWGVLGMLGGLGYVLFLSWLAHQVLNDNSKKAIE